MKKSLLLVMLLFVSLLVVSGCDKKIEFDGKPILLNKEYKDTYFTYKYPSAFLEDEGEEAYPLDVQKTYEYYNNEDEVEFSVKVEEYSLIQDFTDMEDDCSNLENNASHKDVNKEIVKYNKKEFIKYAYSKGREVYNVYYGKYDYSNTKKYVKIYFRNVTGKEDFVEQFMKNFKINK